MPPQSSPVSSELLLPTSAPTTCRPSDQKPGVPGSRSSWPFSFSDGQTLTCQGRPLTSSWICTSDAGCQMTAHHCLSLQCLPALSHRPLFSGLLPRSLQVVNWDTPLASLKFCGCALPPRWSSHSLAWCPEPCIICLLTCSLASSPRARPCTYSTPSYVGLRVVS